MRAVNLLPEQPGNRSLGFSVSPAFGGLIGGLVLVIGGTAVYVGEHNRVDSRQADLSELSIGVAHWSAVAATYSRFTDEARQRAARVASVRQLVETRYDWENLLSEIAGLLPADAQISALSASSPNATVDAAVAPATGSTSSSGAALSLSGCATSQYAVANTMVQLQRVTGVSKVLLISSSLRTASASSSNDCPLSVLFSLSLVFSNSLNPGSSAATSTTATASTTATTSTDSEPVAS